MKYRSMTSSTLAGPPDPEAAAGAGAEEEEEEAAAAAEAAAQETASIATGECAVALVAAPTGNMDGVRKKKEVASLGTVMAAGRGAPPAATVIAAVAAAPSPLLSVLVASPVAACVICVGELAAGEGTAGDGGDGRLLASAAAEDGAAD